MLKPFLILSAVLLTGVSASSTQAQQAATPAAPAAAPVAPAATPAAPAAFQVPLEAVNKVNPVKPSAESLARAKKIYGYECALCHGDDGGGAGDLAKKMKAKMPDFRDPTALKPKTDGELYYVIKNGKGEMDGEGERVKPDDTWNLVNYLRSFSKLQAATAAQGPS
jgi:mono/diheme cytochrome c family protein